MHKLLILLLIPLLIVSGCGFREREKELEIKEQTLNQKEQELNLKEQFLQHWEKELNENKHKLDSSKNTIDTLTGLYPNLPGTWSVKMVCSETTCSGSAVGDTKTELWEIKIQNNAIIASASSNASNGKLTRIYSGGFKEARLELISENTDEQTNEQVKIIIRLKQNKEGNMTGTREIIRTDDCHIVYNVEIKKQKTN